MPNRTLSEFELIRRHFSRPCAHTVLAGGDDAALLQLRAKQSLVVSTDTLVEGVHFFSDADPEALGWKTLAVNLSDIAAMGATPRWATLSLTLPNIEEPWIAAFAAGFYACADRYRVDLVGGDTTRGPRAFTVTVFGEVPENRAITRGNARAEDDLWISGTPGLAALGLATLKGEVSSPEPDRQRFLSALHRPRPRMELGVALRETASAMLDVSDGLLGDLRHILDRSEVGAIVELAALPTEAITAAGIGKEQAARYILSGGDDYELLFAANPAHRAKIAALSAALALPLTRIGHITQNRALLVQKPDGTLYSPEIISYEHFS